jgi:ABC-2 type transport system ATP-binding protein
MSNALAIHNLRKTYRGGVEALKGIDLQVPEGDFFALLGPNGAGKSTAIGIVCSLVKKTTGRVEVFGHDIERDKDAAKSCIGLVPQEFNFNQFEPVEEIVINQAGYYGIPRAEARARTEHYLQQLGLWGKRREMARELSGGMKRRLMIARALVHEPRLLILDEPTAGVDIEIRRSTWKFLQEINAAGTTIILTTHYLEEAEQLCNTIAIINHGRVIENMPKQELLMKLHVETFILNLKQPLPEVPELDGFRISRIDDCTLQVDISRKQTVNALFEVLNRHGIQVLSMRNKTNRLEELFMRILGEQP